jgi:Protein of unknown function (DUF1800)
MAEVRKRKKKKRKRCRTVRRTKVVDGRRKKVKVRKCRPRRRKRPVLAPGGTHPPAPVVAAPAAGDPPPPASPPPAGRLKTIQSPIGVYTGAFGRAQAERLLWRAGCGPRPGQVEALAALDLEAAVMSLTRPTGVAPMDGPEPTVDGQPLDVLETWYGDTLYWFDRLVRSRHQLVERLALVFHDWWATSNDAVGSSQFMLEQTNVFRTHGLGSFADMVRAVTAGPAMLVFLDGISNRRGAVNENYARELMELFTLGADRGAYTETDVRELARALSGWRADWVSGVGFANFRWDEVNRWDPTVKTVFGGSGRFTWEDACRMVVQHAMHASFFVAKLWSYFIPVPPEAGVAARLEATYRDSGFQVRPILEAILCSPEFYEGPRMTKPPAVFAAGLLRAREVPIDDERWVWLADGAGQRLYYPPDVSGWDDDGWLDTNTVRARWEIVNEVMRGQSITSATWSTYPAESADEAVAKARAFWLDPSLTDETVASLREFAASSIPASANASLRAQRQNALRQLIAASPDYQTC